jgi:hypothetical protein
MQVFKWRYFSVAVLGRQIRRDYTYIFYCSHGSIIYTIASFSPLFRLQAAPIVVGLYADGPTRGLVRRASMVMV